MPQVTGILTVSINGIGKLRTKEQSSKLKTGGKSREAVVGGVVVHGFVEKVVPAELETTLIHMAETDIDELNNITDATLVVETDTGVTYTVTNAFVVDPLEINEGTGEMPLKMMGDPATQSS